MPTYPLGPFNVIALHAQIKAASVAALSFNSDGYVHPEDLQAAAQPIIDAYDNSPAAQRTRAFADTVASDQHALESPTDRDGLMVRAILAVIGKEMTLDPDYLVTEVHAALAAAKAT